MTLEFEEIISGEQTGADRAAPDFTFHFDIRHSRWCPAGRRAEDWALALQYRLKKAPIRDYGQSTRWNVRSLDSTAVFTLDRDATGRSLLTLAIDNRIGRPNVAESQESTNSGVYRRVMQVLEGTLGAERRTRLLRHI